MILVKILDHDLHRSRKGVDAIPLWLETPAKAAFLPAVVSSSRGSFLVSRKLTKDEKIRSGVFSYDSDRLDEAIGNMMSAAHALSVKEGWKNVFCGKSAAASAFSYIQESSGMKSQPHACLVPEIWSDGEVQKFMGKDLDSSVYCKICRVYLCKVPFPVMLSRPDFVGMYTQFVGGKSSIILHNIKNGIAFCPSLGA